MNQDLILTKQAGVAILTLNRPEQLNAITQPMMESLIDMLRDLGQDADVGALILTGAGRGFCSGFNVDALSQVSVMTREKLSDYILRILKSVYDFPKPTIAAINGVATGAGLALALLCDIRIGSDKCRLTAGYIKIGLTPDVGTTYFLPRIAGTSRTMEFLLTGEIIDAAEAYRVGIINRILPETELLSAARAIAEKIARGPAIAVKLTRQEIRAGIDNTLEQQLEMESSAIFTALRTEDHKEGRKAFLEKRQAEFKGG